MNLPVTMFPREDRCHNGACTRQIYRGAYCWRCWIGTKWTSIIQRLKNANGHCASYVGVPLGFTREEFLAWCEENPPPPEIERPSIDRIEPSLGYVPGNIRWLDVRDNSRGPNRDLPRHLRRCAICSCVKPESDFPKARKKGKATRSSYCLSCNRTYQNQWEIRRANRIP